MKTFEIPQYESEDEAFAAEFDGLEYADNFRIAGVGYEDELSAYMENFNTNECWRKSEIIARGDFWDLRRMKVLANAQLKLEDNNVS